MIPDGDMMNKYSSSKNVYMSRGKNVDENFACRTYGGEKRYVKDLVA